MNYELCTMNYELKNFWENFFENSQKRYIFATSKHLSGNNRAIIKIDNPDCNRAGRGNKSQGTRLDDLTARSCSPIFIVLQKGVNQ